MVSPRTVSFYASLVLLVAGGSAIAAQASSLQSAPTSTIQLTQTPANTSPVRLLTRRIQQDLAQRLNVSPSSLQIIEATPQTWPDQCLGLARPNERCRGGEVRGWQVQVASAQQMWTYRSDRFGTRLKLEPLAAAPDFGTGDFSIETSQRLLQAVAEQVNQPIDRLSVLEVQSATWDGCLGVYQPDLACTAIALAGFRTLVSDGQTVWVYHLSEDGEQIAQNPTASGAQLPLLVSFMPVEESLSPDDDLGVEVVFQSQLSGDLAGSVQRTVLMADGQLYREQIRPLDGGQPVREQIATLSAEEVDAFRRQLEQHRFSNLNRTRYLTEAAFADYPTIRLQTPYASVDYIDLAIEQLPSDLKAVITLWDDLTQTQ
ncbi:hypothetical protein [Sphaerothrix gracilis]|uniref:hypothetical protein n=1 Tax=Sphaerothrix gracilis TaxID=3151835 RepID=UPI0031FD9C72